jgi:hypothetical protein
MATASATSTTTTTTPPPASTKPAGSVVAVYRNHADAEAAVRRLERAGIPLQKISIIGRNFELREDIQGYYRPSDAALEGAGFADDRVQSEGTGIGVRAFAEAVWVGFSAWTVKMHSTQAKTLAKPTFLR